ncbi:MULTISPECIES: undecaprenyldiphospho-muramoylpentapeptide beta-N-acetylglucosaminyltransferase [Flavobacteriaceae]|uniref:UDP-N-acetylglucosamine--N-acetylmuramyl-(pentapeptide) pyrophosphoryl-undecaprenol N-acetylglucosamine transferase n=2 Tax=Flavobacteriaceae TaxID=49546 RepID=A0A4Y8AUH2_9FLAO|nr:MULTISPECIES: undecaprenyldiphospho-muramoylpentapeptide beta-N-acetylglucosaminyltransferase [Flavobacteriaceae]TEW75016.1 undecaprenyldiphospho-muramoylpentapeptide beta-N-acetylglucosaminyltransferase [Gramella jeungdoensis]GGK42272.1 UDP-N-acetylglucosamine--N-acetylmuramyl-(pentapeptide) pyrophosphoryl-undecaprenol N-acetylglucosamine transferase [Lutibacter litoralis]
MKQSINIILSGGGTGGHIYPAVSIANQLKEKYPEANFLFVGAKDRMEMEKVPQAGYEIKGLWISGIQRSLSLKNLAFPFKLISSLWNAFKIIKKFKPTIVIGTGGFASGPTLYAASIKGVKTVIQEQNSYPGITNKLLSKKADTICVAYDGLERFFPADKIVKTGNPVRQDLLAIESKREEAIDFFDLKTAKKTLLIIGGSLGARAINNLIEKYINWLVENNIQVIWQTGKLYYNEFKKYDALEGVQIHAFLNRMDLTYAAADFIISRAGASSISELCIVGKPVIFIPSPNVAEDHQTKNALSVVNKNAALLLKESELNMFENMFLELNNNPELQQRLSKNIKELALPNATKDIVLEIEKLIYN